MTEIQWYDVMRVVNIVLTVVALSFLAVAWKRQVEGWNNKTADHWYALVGLVFVLGLGSVENIAQDNPPGSRVLVHTVVLVILLRALLRKEKLEAGPTFKGHDRG